jgi:hypothetical protein
LEGIFLKQKQGKRRAFASATIAVISLVALAFLVHGLNGELDVGLFLC